MKNLSFKVIEDAHGSGLSICYLSSSDFRLVPIEKTHASALGEILKRTSETNSAIIVWYGSESSVPFPNIAGSNRLNQPTSMKGEMEPVFWKFCSISNDFLSDLPVIWNSFGGIQIYPSTSEGDIDRIVYPHFFDKHDEKRLGLDPENQELPQIDGSEGLDFVLSKTIQTSLDFVKKLANDDFREDLMNPFRYKKDVELIRKVKSFCRKSGYDNDVYLEILTSTKNPEIIVAEIFKDHKLECEISKEIRSKWG